MALPEKLFRQEVVEFQQHQREWGGIVLLQPVPTKVLSWSLASAIGLIVAFLCIAQYARKETVAGYLTPTTGTAKIFAPQVGTVSEVHVREGDTVQKGQPLLTVETAQVSTDGQDVNASILANLARQRSLLSEQVAAEERRVASERDRLMALVRGLELQISHLNNAIKLQSERIEISKAFVASGIQLNTKGYTADIEIKRRQQIVLEQQQTLSTLGEELSVRENQRTETQYSLAQLPTVMAQKVQALRNELSSAEQRMAEIDSRRAYVIRSPAAGTVSTLQSMVGQAVDTRRLQLEIVPSNSTLQAELFIPTRAVGLVEVGQDVRLLYEAFPYQKFGTYRGRIVKLSQTVLVGSDVAGPVVLKEPSYKATVSLARNTVSIDDKVVPLQADMLLSADIILEKRSIMTWLFDPLLGARKIIDMESFGQMVSQWLAALGEGRDWIAAHLAELGLLRRPAATADAKDQRGT
ncbi:HlyD family efflux transporter periplasmic adaptor subunit [Microvirga pudoricolor]|uniref:HlyD family efflux transporter periplasmic adaptor subunit n=1 Tax=Microvirga pudoricolor TaxID=2778729 RepID=UPI0019514F9A|nr:HlyD family efflux transporter periplasmic adaptor subunit [Microvirga pudoricolor]MBM6596762.1 HlyD family efflux transporter periplasmic adaptor subunit [Microvirga pudoricolor]